MSICSSFFSFFSFFFFNDTATTEIYTLSLHDALPIAATPLLMGATGISLDPRLYLAAAMTVSDRKSTRLNSSHPSISYAVFCLKKKIQNSRIDRRGDQVCRYEAY